jgi:hypothetical protein
MIQHPKIYAGYRCNYWIVLTILPKKDSSGNHGFW